MNHPEGMQIFKALADETRLRIVEILSCGELCACDILDSFDFTQPTLSYHMKILVESGLVHARKDGSWMRYSLDAERVEQIAAYWSQLTTGGVSCICHATAPLGSESSLHTAPLGSESSLHTAPLGSESSLHHDALIAKSTTNKEGNPTCAL